MDDKIISTEGQLESGETRDTQERALDDATHEPGAHVEQSGDYQQAEAVQHALEKLTEEAVREDAKFEEIKPDLNVVVAYGQIIPDSIIYYPRHNSVNLHFSHLCKIFQRIDIIRKNPDAGGVHLRHLVLGYDPVIRVPGKHP